MSSQLTAYIALVCTSGVLNAYLCVFVLIRRYLYKDVARFFIFYSAATTVYCFGSAFGLMAISLEEIRFWTVIQYIGMPFAPPIGLLFIMKYLGRTVTKKKIVMFLVLPFITFIMVATNPWHHLHYRVFEIDPILGVPYVHQEIGISYMIHGVFIFSCMFAAFFLVLAHWKDTESQYRPQLVALLWGQIVPILTAFLYLVGFTPPGIDPVPMVLWLTSLLYLLSINTSSMFKIMPIAKDAIFNSINDGVIVLDEMSRLIEFNEACRGMFPQLDKAMFGMDFKKVWLELAETSFPSAVENSSFIWEAPSQAGIHNHVYKVHVSPLNPAQGVKGILIIFTDITEIKRLQAQLESQAYYDELTGVYNRRAFFERCEVDITMARKEMIPFTVVLFDVDYFKKVNDTYGHQAGDEVLIHVAQICETELDNDVLFGRYGGEEFVLGLKGKSLAEGEYIANQLRKSVENQPLINGERVITITLSGGVAELHYEQELTLNELLNQADTALYAAKHQGRNRICIYQN